jgi:curved DNA-binding protein CbpA
MAGLNLDCCPAAAAIGIETQQQQQQQHDYKKSFPVLNAKPTPPRRHQRLVMMEPTTTTATTSTSTTWTNNKSNTPLNPYDVLKLRKDATPSEIVLSYRKLALFHHPGRKKSGTSSCPIELRRRMEFFEVLAACYETLMHNEFRRRYDILLKDIEKKQKHQQNYNNNNNNNNKTYFIQPRSTKNAAKGYYNNELVVKMADSIPGLIPSTSSSDKEGGGSDDTIPTNNNCSSMMFLCGASSPPFADDGENKNKNINTTSNFTMSRDGTKGFKSLMDSHRNKTSSVSASLSSSQGGSGEEGEDGGKREAEIHFSEATVNRLFGGPLASLHRARNFQTFTDPYLVFNKVFGCTNAYDPILFPRVKATDIHHHNRNHHSNGSTCTSTTGNNNNELTPFNDNKIENGGSYSNRILTRSTSMSSQWNQSRLDGNEVNNGSTNDQQTATFTKVFVSSRIIHGRKITKTETVYVDPETGMASVNVTVDGEYLDDISTTTNNNKSKRNKNKNTKASLSQHHHIGEGGVGAVVSDWLLCFGTSTSKVCPSSTTTKNNCNPCRRIKSVYIEVLEEFYLCNNNFYEECNRYMSCGG